MKTLLPAPTACRKNIPLASSVYPTRVLQSHKVSDIARSRISLRQASPAQRQANETRLAIVANVCIMAEPGNKQKKEKKLFHDSVFESIYYQTLGGARGRFVEKKHSGLPAQGIFYPFGSAEGDTRNAAVDDGSSSVITLLSPFLFFGRTHQQIYAGYDTVNSTDFFVIPGSNSGNSISNLKNSSNVHVPGRWAFRVDSGHIPSQGIFYPLGSAAGDTRNTAVDDGSSSVIPLLIPFLFFGRTHQQIYVRI
ncbi:unnamed protein product [Leuciscus chuanchicus]